MQSQTNLKPLIVIIGPTGVGKTEISLYLAERHCGEIVSADSRLLYRGMDIGTAKPTIEERTRVKHHLIDVAEPDQVWSLAKYQKAAVKSIDDIHQCSRIPILVGGSGQYIWAVVEGWNIPEVKPDRHLREGLQNWVAEIGSSALYDRLAYLDPKTAAKIEPQNTRRVIRALEVIFSTGNLFSVQKSKSGSPYSVLILGIIRPRQELYERIDVRIDEMIKAGFVKEVQNLLDQGLSPDLPSMSAIGYRQMTDYLLGKITLEEAVLLIKRLTRQYVRRQANWFKQDDPNIHWFPVGPDIFEKVEVLIKRFLKTNRG